MKFKLGGEYLVRIYNRISKIKINDITKTCYLVQFERFDYPRYELIKDFDEEYELIECLDD